MVAVPRRKRLTLPLAPVVGLIAGASAALVFALIPGPTLNDLISASGIPAFINAAQPPLNFNGRFILMLGVGGLTALLVWFALFLIVGSRMIAWGTAAASDDHAADGDEPVPVLRRADAHPDAPARRPVFANRDLGTPFLEVHAPHNDVGPAADAVAATPVDRRPLPLKRPPQPIPADLDQPIAAFDPFAARNAPPPPPTPPPSPPPVMAVPPMAGSAPLPIRRPVFEPGERMETFELPRSPAAPQDAAPLPPRAPRAPRAPGDTQATISALLERLEQGVSERAAQAPTPASRSAQGDRAGLRDTLGELRRMATRG